MVLTIDQSPASTGFQMAGKGNGRLDCTHTSNPYHVCSEHCSGKNGESKKQIVRKDSGYGGTKQDSRPKPSRELNVPLASAVSSKPQVIKPHVSPEEKIDLRNGDCIKPYAEETCFVEDSLPIEEQKKFSQLILVSANALKADNLQKPQKTDASSLTSVKSKEDINTRHGEISEIVEDSPVHDEEECDHTTASPNITNFLFPAIARSHEESDEEEDKSVSSEPSVPVGKYYIKASLAPILQSIFDEHGDIAASCNLESTSIRSYYLECVCSIIQELQCPEFSQKVSKSKVKELLAILNDIVSSEMNVGWLHSILNDVAEAVESGGQQWTLEVAKANCDHELQLTKKELESQMEDLSRKEKEMSDAKTKVADTRARLSELEFKYLQLNGEISSLQFKANDLKCNALTDELL